MISWVGVDYGQCSIPGAVGQLSRKYLAEQANSFRAAGAIVLHQSLPERWHMAMLEAFTWGYWGWGSESRHFVRAVDWLEQQRGFRSPLFVDLRIARGGRAVNFKGTSFQKIVGSARYRWMPTLGNKRIKSNRGVPIQIADPAAVDDLLDLIVDNAGNRRRIIMFCACEHPLLKLEDGYPSCHRVAVATLLLKAARSRRLHLETSEWPGEAPKSFHVQADGDQAKALAKGARFIPIGSKKSRLPAMSVLGWGSTVRFDTHEASCFIVTGPASVRGDRWRLGIVANGTFMGKTAAASAQKRGDSLRRAGYGTRSTRKTAGSMP